MNRITAFASRLAKDEQGAALVEYGLLIGLIAVACIAALTTFQGRISALFGRIGGDLDGVAP
ncbi:Flp family type IVb pilin [Azospirillum sp.]|uniref:Flp family type IVb pilin n=1 Tax=Azospirillum sp. TaxID=34012 RepID=UPI002D4DD07B|nr:Flp family type IVb pilin [Azospirillum sp.]HYD66414.1 Flp family type IVb pilin [Azospirillum sp.]